MDRNQFSGVELCGIHGNCDDRCSCDSNWNQRQSVTVTTSSTNDTTIAWAASATLTNTAFNELFHNNSNAGTSASFQYGGTSNAHTWTVSSTTWAAIGIDLVAAAVTVGCNNKLVVDWGGGSNTNVPTAAIADGSIFGIWSGNGSVTSAATSLALATSSYHNFGGAKNVNCNNQWPGDTNSTLGLLFTLAGDTISDVVYTFPSFITTANTMVRWFWFRAHLNAQDAHLMNLDFGNFRGTSNYVNFAVKGNTVDSSNFQVGMETGNNGPTPPAGTGYCPGHLSGTNAITGLQWETWYIAAQQYSIDTTGVIPHKISIYNANATLYGSVGADAIGPFNWTSSGTSTGSGTTTNIGPTSHTCALSCSGATFKVVRSGGTYTVTQTSANANGTLYSATDVLTIAGTSLGGSSPANDLTITLTSGNQSSATPCTSDKALTASYGHQSTSSNPTTLVTIDIGDSQVDWAASDSFSFPDFPPAGASGSSNLTTLGAGKHQYWKDWLKDR